MTTKISIVVPIYNVEKYLRRCVDSILNQTLKDIEVILATDGGEECDEICKEYAKRDARVTLVMHPGSYGKAFNKSLEVAKGEYIGIVEADDWIDATMYEKLYSKALEYNKADVVKCGFWFAYENTKNNWCELYRDRNENMNIFEDGFFISSQPSVWSCIYKKSFLIVNKIDMIERRQSFIDVPFHYETLIKAKKYCLLKEPLYYYYQDNPNQTVQNVKPLDGLNSEKYAYEHIFGDIDLYNKVKEGLAYSTALHLKWNYSRLKKSDIKTFWDATHDFLKNMQLNDLKYVYFNNDLKEFFDCLRQSSYLQFKICNLNQCVKNAIKKSLQQVFSLKNNYTRSHKIITILGIKIKVKRNSRFIKELGQKILSIRNSGDKLHKVITILGVKFKVKNYKRIRQNKKEEIKQLKSIIMDTHNNLNNLIMKSAHTDTQISNLQTNLSNQSNVLQNILCNLEQKVLLLLNCKILFQIN